MLLILPGLAQADDLTALSLEELMAIKAVATPQFAGQTANLPASVSILTARDIRAYGWRTLADALRSLRGFNVTYDRTYSYVGVRGMSPPGDYKPRLSILIDGISTSENIYNSVLIGGEFPLDIDLIERIEVVRGPGASVVGGDAMGGVINIITRRGAALRGAEVAASAGSGDALGGRASAGGMSSAGIEYLFSASGYSAQGEKLRFPEMAPLGGGTTTSNDDEHRHQLFAKIGYAGWHATVIHGDRRKVVPTGSYGTVFDDPAHQESDIETLVEVGHEASLGVTSTLSTRVFSGYYGYDGTFPYTYAEPAYYRNRDRARGRWWGTEARLQSGAWKGHRVMAGVEFTDYYRQDQRNYDVGFGCIGYGSASCIDNRHDSSKASIYGQDEILLAAQTRLTLGLRLDRTVDNDTRPSQRVGLVQHTAAGTFKLLYATAYRQPSAFEKYYATPSGTIANAELRDEYLRSFEGIWEYALDTRTQFSAVLYQYRADHVIAVDSDGIYQNLPTMTGRGAELELNRIWAGGASLRSSYALQFPELSGTRPANAPQHLLKLNLSLPLAAAWHAGFELQAVSRRDSEVDATLGGYGIANLNLIYAPRGQAWEFALGVYNLFDKHYADPIARDDYMDPSVVRDGIAQDGRNWRAKLTFRL